MLGVHEGVVVLDEGGGLFRGYSGGGRDWEGGGAFFWRHRQLGHAGIRVTQGPVLVVCGKGLRIGCKLFWCGLLCQVIRLVRPVGANRGGSCDVTSGGGDSAS